MAPIIFIIFILIIMGIISISRPDVLPHPKYVYTFPTFKTKYHLFLYQAIHFGHLSFQDSLKLWRLCKHSEAHIKLWNFIMQLPRNEIMDNVQFYYKLYLVRTNNIL